MAWVMFPPKQPKRSTSTVAGVFSGAVFGDHCSTLSDTPIVSSIARGIEPLEHVRTQLPYALLAAVAAALIGCLPAGFGIPAWLLLPAGFGALALLPTVLVRGRGTRKRDSDHRGKGVLRP
jgi:Na+/H+ antiporter NhaC